MKVEVEPTLSASRVASWMPTKLSTKHHRICRTLDLSWRLALLVKLEAQQC